MESTLSSVLSSNISGGSALRVASCAKLSDFTEIGRDWKIAANGCPADEKRPHCSAPANSRDHAQAAGGSTRLQGQRQAFLSREAAVARAMFDRQRLCRCHLPCRPDRQLQHLAKCAQICIPWSNVIGFPKIDARRADADLLGYFSNR